MVLVDTSVWVRFLANKPQYSQEFERLLATYQVAGHELVYGELLVGDRGARRKLLALYGQMQQAGIVPHREVVEFVLNRNLQGRSIGWIDVHLLASALVEKCSLWTADSRLLAVAAEFGVAYEPIR